MKRFLLWWTVDLWYRMTMSYREQMIQGVGHGRRPFRVKKSKAPDPPVPMTREQAACVIRFTAFLGRAIRAMDEMTAASNQSTRAFQAMADVIEEDDLWKAWSGINGIDNP